ncbi:hypothetical protein SHM_26820 [Spiroplasma ixodetis]|uniref:Uncharacterized protein n=1 Tax=Spiroplasma ixodetis TaxID=2141 RepID=A0ABN6T4J1_9MOLU|nr:hypothetical protein SHM_26820 [Spiroplasma ixodetis]
MKFLYENFLQFYLLALTSIIQHFSEINIFYMMTNQHGWKIVTNAVGNYLEIEPE